MSTPDRKPARELGLDFVERDALEIGAALQKASQAESALGPGGEGAKNAAGIERPRREEHRGLFIGCRAEDHRRYRGLFDQHRRQRSDRDRRRRPWPELDSQGQLIAAVERDMHDVSATQALVVANDDQLIEMPAILADGR